MGNNTQQSVWGSRPAYEAMWLNPGDYKVEILEAKENMSGDPMVNLRVIESTHGKGVNGRINKSFHGLVDDSKGTEKSRAYNQSMFDGLRRAVGLGLGAMPEDYKGKELVVRCKESGRDVPISFLPVTQYGNAPVRVVPPPAQRVQQMQSAVAMQEPSFDINDDDGIPF